ncbi:hypothetical protein DE146DRAFT_62262 [Phaeosphaeria sp. MPI-PUGE-AT-0046c]|nr:hypothetical protein DE146DRAFT_62262 [Phaeosphaeria sp. MPI-PUGE-AT-0046c]
MWSASMKRQEDFSVWTCTSRFIFLCVRQVLGNGRTSCQPTVRTVGLQCILPVSDLPQCLMHTLWDASNVWNRNVRCVLRMDSQCSACTHNVVCFRLQIILSNFPSSLSTSKHIQTSRARLQNTKVTHRSTILCKLSDIPSHEQSVSSMTYIPLHTSLSSTEESLYEPVYVDFRILLPFGIVPPGFENCVPQIPAVEPWEEETYVAPRNKSFAAKLSPVLIDKFEFKCCSDCESECKCERADSVMEVEVSSRHTEELMAVRSRSKKPVSASTPCTGHEAVMADPAIVHVAFAVPDPERKGEMIKINVSSTTAEERKARRSRSRSPGHAGFRCKAAQETFERELVKVPRPPERFLAKLRAKQN